MAMFLQVDKPDTLMGEIVHIKARGLQPHSTYKMVMRLRHRIGSHAAFAVFKADGAGNIDVPTTKPIRGTYYDADPMGLFLSQLPCQDYPYGAFLKCTPHVPFIYKIMLFDSADSHIDTLLIRKRWMHPLLERTEIDEDGFCATLFKPPGNGPFPCVIDISGTGGGLYEHKGALLASEGFVVLCVAFFNYKSLVKSVDEVEFEYFEKPVKWLLSQPYTNDVLGMQGLCFGATIINTLATRIPAIKAVVSVNSPPVQNSMMRLRENGRPVNAEPSNNDYTLVVNGLLIISDELKHVVETEESRFRVEDLAKDVAFRFVGCMDDMVAPSVYTARKHTKALHDVGIYDVEVDLVNGGHIMDPPYFPHHDVVYAPIQSFYYAYGGDAVLHGKGQELSWRRTVAFFKRTLGTPPPMPEWERLHHITEETAKL